MAEPLEDAVESADKKVALIIAILALFLALAEAGAKNAEHRSTEQNIESSRSVQFLPSQEVALDDRRNRRADPRGRARRGERPQGAGGARQADRRLEGDGGEIRKGSQEARGQPGRDSGARHAAAEGRELSNRKLEHFEYASGALQIAIVLASAAIITGVAVLAWLAAGLGVLGGFSMAFGYLAPTVLGFL